MAELIGGSGYDNVQNTEPTSPSIGDTWLDTSTDPPTGRIYADLGSGADWHQANTDEYSRRTFNALERRVSEIWGSDSEWNSWFRIEPILDLITSALSTSDFTIDTGADISFSISDSAYTIAVDGIGGGTGSTETLHVTSPYTLSMDSYDTLSYEYSHTDGGAGYDYNWSRVGFRESVGGSFAKRDEYTQFDSASNETTTLDVSGLTGPHYFGMSLSTNGSSPVFDIHSMTDADGNDLRTQHSPTTVSNGILHPSSPTYFSSYFFTSPVVHSDRNSEWDSVMYETLGDASNVTIDVVDTSLTTQYADVSQLEDITLPTDSKLMLDVSFDGTDPELSVAAIRWLE